MPYYQAERKRTYVELVRVYAETKKEANIIMNGVGGEVLKTSTESTVSVVPKTTVIDIDAEQRCRKLFEEEQQYKQKQDDSE